MDPNSNYCPDPQPPPEGGFYDWSITLANVTAYNTEVAYGCDKGRALTHGGTGAQKAEFKTKCQWNQTWSQENVKNTDPYIGLY